MSLPEEFMRMVVTISSLISLRSCLLQYALAVVSISIILVGKSFNGIFKFLKQISKFKGENGTFQS